MVVENENKDARILTYQQLAPELYSLAQYELEEIINALPILCSDTDLIWDLLLKVYGEDCFNPNIVKKFPAQFTGDLRQQKQQFAGLQAYYDAKISTFNEYMGKEVGLLKV